MPHRDSSQRPAHWWDRLERRPNAPSKTRHEKYPSETGGGNDAFGARSETQRRRDIPRMARNRGISKAHSQITVKTGLAGWGGRIRTSASEINSASLTESL